MSSNNQASLRLLAILLLSFAWRDVISQNDRFHIDSLFPSNVSDTLNVKRFGFTKWASDGIGQYQLNSVHGTHDYFPTYDVSLIRNDLGNIGSANYHSLFDKQRTFGFHLRTSRDAYWKPLKERTLLISERMYSNVQYSNGINRENFLEANLTRSFGELLNMGFCFKRIISKGFYEQQQNVFTDFSIYSTFNSNDNRYKAVVMFDYSNLKANENGGIANDSVFELNFTSGRSFIPVNLSESSNHWKGFDFGLEHIFSLSRSDSTKSSKGYKPAIAHSFSVARHSMIYRNVLNENSNFYEHIYSDSVITYDSTNLFNASNVLRFELLRSDPDLKKIINRASVGVGHDYNRISYDSSVTTVIHNLSVEGGLNGTLFKGMNWEGNGSFMFYGYNILDLSVDGLVDYWVGRSRFTALVDYSLYRPDLITDRYSSNHFVWDNDWVQTQHLKTGLIYEQSKLRFKGTFTYHVIDNLVAFGADRSPYQSKSVNQLMVLRLKEHFRIKWFHIVADGALQLRLSGDDIRVPMVSGRGMFYYQNDLFKKKLRLQLGVEVSYATGYFANAYNPALSEFHIQNEKRIGNYPFIDVFLNIRVKKLRAFFKIEHLNAGWLGYTYYHVPHYPVNDLSWKFGVNWAFLD